MSVQDILHQCPKLKHVVYVDQKKVSTEGYPAGTSIHSMQSVLELGVRPEHGACCCSASFPFSVFYVDGKITAVCLSCSGERDSEARTF